MAYASIPGVIDQVGGSDAFAELEQEALAATLGDPQVAGQLSPLVVSFSGILSMGADVAGFLTETGDISPRDAARFAINLGIQLAQQVAEAIGGAFGELIGSVLPIAQFIIGAAFSQDYAGQSPQQQEQAAIDWCRTSSRPIVGTGTGGKVMPADVFVSELVLAAPGGWTPNVGSSHYLKYRPGVGRAFWLVESRGYGDTLSAFQAACAKYVVKGQGKVGMSSKTRLALANLRQVIELSAVTGDDAQIAWLLYLDIFNTSFRNGEMTDLFADFITSVDASAAANNAGPGPGDLLQAMKVLPDHGSSPEGAIQSMNVHNCRRYGRPGLDGMMAILNGWKLTVEPRWNADKLKNAEVIVEARKAVERLTRVQLLAAALKRKFHGFGANRWNV